MGAPGSADIGSRRHLSGRLLKGNPLPAITDKLLLTDNGGASWSVVKS